MNKREKTEIFLFYSGLRYRANVTFAAMRGGPKATTSMQAF